MWDVAQDPVSKQKPSEVNKNQYCALCVPDTARQLLQINQGYTRTLSSCLEGEMFLFSPPCLPKVSVLSYIYLCFSRSSLTKMIPTAHQLCISSIYLWVLVMKKKSGSNTGLSDSTIPTLTPTWILESRNCNIRTNLLINYNMVLIYST